MALPRSILAIKQFLVTVKAVKQLALSTSVIDQSYRDLINFMGVVASHRAEV
tara:strand:- start:9470 stop:9625 length:156 start_codon:yes stop_codon:yes gene_type:complete